MKIVLAMLAAVTLSITAFGEEATKPAAATKETVRHR
jgi:hypothetical protein